MTARRYHIEIPAAALVDLRDRLRRTRWPSEIPGSGWTYGTDKAYLQELCAYWADEFGWRAPEVALNRHDHSDRETFPRRHGGGALGNLAIRRYGSRGATVSMK